MQPKLTLDTREFKRTLAAYMRTTKRDLSAVLNGWAYDIAKDAVEETYKATKMQINMDMNIVGRNISKTTSKRSKRPFKGGKAIYATGKGGAPVGALIINASRGRRGEKGLYGKSMKEAIKTVYNSRARAIGGLKAGWLPAVVKLGRQVGVKRFSKPTMKYKERMGGAVAARPGWKPQAVLWNAAFAKVTRNVANTAKHIERGLRAAINKKIAVAKARMEAKLQKTANRYSARR